MNEYPCPECSTTLQEVIAPGHGFVFQCPNCGRVVDFEDEDDE